MKLLIFCEKGEENKRHWVETKMKDILSKHKLLFTVRVIKHQKSLPGEAVVPQSLQILKIQLDIGCRWPCTSRAAQTASLSSSLMLWHFHNRALVHSKTVTLLKHFLKIWHSLPGNGVSQSKYFLGLSIQREICESSKTNTGKFRLLSD